MLLDADGQLITDATRCVPADAFCPTDGSGLAVPGDTEVSDLPEGWRTAPLMAIEFPSFADGRGLSLAVMLRTQHGYTGRLRASGDVILDLLHYMRRCGFDEFELRADQDVEACRRSLARKRLYYPGSVIDPEPVFRRAAG